MAHHSGILGPCIFCLLSEEEMAESRKFEEHQPISLDLFSVNTHLLSIIEVTVAMSTEERVVV